MVQHINNTQEDECCCLEVAGLLAGSSAREEQAPGHRWQPSDNTVRLRVPQAPAGAAYCRAPSAASHEELKHFVLLSWGSFSPRADPNVLQWMLRAT